MFLPEISEGAPPPVEAEEAEMRSLLSYPDVHKTLRILDSFFYFVGSVWFLIEALFLQYQISMNVFGAEKSKNKKILVAAGWGIPVLFAIPWIVFIDRRYELDHIEQREMFLNSSCKSIISKI